MSRIGHLARLAVALVVGSSAAVVAPATASAAPATAPQLPAPAEITPAPEMDDRVIFQSFSLYQPYESTMYRELAGKTDQLNQWGVTDVWLPPAYRSFGMARYLEGYAIADRYDLGEFPQGPDGAVATKYGTSDELKSLMDDLHAADLRGQIDIVPNQVMGLGGQEPVQVSRVDNAGNRWNNRWTTHRDTELNDKLYLAYTKGGGMGQAKYGKIKEFNKDHFNGTSLQQTGMGYVLTDADGKPFRVHQPDAAQNNAPDWWNPELGINNVEGYLAADGAFEFTKDNWKPLVWKADPNFTTFALDPAHADSCGYENADELEKPGDQQIWTCRDAFLASQDTYGTRSEEPSFANDESGIDMHDQLLFDTHGPIDQSFGHEFLVGNDLNNASPEVQAEQKRWMEWLLDTYEFDGFRIDAAAHYDTDILEIEKDVVNEHFGGDRSKFTSYLEAYYTDQQASYTDRTGNQQLAMDGDLFYNIQGTLGRRSGMHWMSQAYTHSMYNRVENQGPARPNWSFVNNHDQEKNRVNLAAMKRLGITPNHQWGDNTPRSFEEEYSKELEKAALGDYNADLKKVDKELSPVNVPSMYAVMLTNANTVPTVFYGDMFTTDAGYMEQKTPYHDQISALLEARKAYAKGPQDVQLFQLPGDVAPGMSAVASVRAGEGRGTGLATVVSNNPTIDQTVRVNMGRDHANQKYRDVTGNNGGELVTDGQGFLTVRVKGETDVQTHGYLGVWAPVDDQVTNAVHGQIKQKWDSLGGNTGVMGRVTGPEACFLAGGGCFQAFEHGRIYWSPATGAHFVRGDIDRRWAAEGWEAGFMGYPATDEICRDGYCLQEFQNGTVNWRPARGATLIKGRILAEWNSIGKADGPVGLAVSEENCHIRGGCFQIYEKERGHIYWSPATDAHFVRGEIFREWGRMGWETSRMGFPTGPEACGLVRGGCFQTYQDGAIYWSHGTGAHPVFGKIREHWANNGWEAGRYGYPVAAEQCSVTGNGLTCSQRYQNGTIRWSERTGWQGSD